MNRTPAPARFDAFVAALNAVMNGDMPADVALHQFFRLRPELGSQDRAYVAENLYAALRRIVWLRSLVPDSNAVRRLALATLLLVQGRSVRDLQALCRDEEERTWLEDLRRAPASDSLALQADLPQWVVDRLLQADVGEEAVRALGRAMQSPAPLDLRVNTILSTREEALQALRAEGLDAEPTPWSPVGIRVPGRPALQRLPLFSGGRVEVQDEGSQLLGYLVAPRRRDMVADFCAGAGGKTLMLGALMHNQGRVYAFDVSERRLNNLKPRLKRSGLSNLTPVLISGENDARVRRLAGKMDRVLVDAPCSGLGTLRRNPDLKLRQNEVSVAELVTKQATILRAAANLVKPGGRLVYATCSLLPEENDLQADRFAAEHPQFKAVSCGALFAAQHVPLEMGERLHLWPQVHGTDGFFAAVWERQPD
ncbi:MAG: RsmB/NOP family class I SAM-dependent RNA methyltransferase [Betaproteobacteria bacterium]|nr:RsmB/NOP family class I SAM-dependent RNA methyltransferase [Betaproteobacteria bacterium]MDE2622273.1 RsmB/NOP family class I SAM-dependent RNA methyltransferase [Betaproteobacteria bacterium]